MSEIIYKENDANIFLNEESATYIVQRKFHEKYPTGYSRDIDERGMMKRQDKKPVYYHLKAKVLIDEVTSISFDKNSQEITGHIRGTFIGTIYYNFIEFNDDQLALSSEIDSKLKEVKLDLKWDNSSKRFIPVVLDFYNHITFDTTSLQFDKEKRQPIQVTETHDITNKIIDKVNEELAQGGSIKLPVVPIFPVNTSEPEWKIIDDLLVFGVCVGSQKPTKSGVKLLTNKIDVAYHDHEVGVSVCKYILQKLIPPFIAPINPPHNPFPPVDEFKMQFSNN